MQSDQRIVHSHWRAPSGQAQHAPAALRLSLPNQIGDPCRHGSGNVARMGKNAARNAFARGQGVVGR
jgi:hypothetical protein